jgi:two-component system, NarL family, nitrate/nitrite sensor histidine kinase NarX
VSVRIRVGVDELRIEVEDRGVGIVGAAVDDDPHFGLRLMRDRAERIGGTIEIESKPGNGTRVVAVLPVGG